ncbi:class I SAM-dependent methyltransferase [Nonomuraea helvata]|uniref:Class I SAM-dependent methyltransferase n=1 Tax=Nonomuraea helvata TaxID=37484 RepID=A0ABV5SHF7_9ACTN
MDLLSRLSRFNARHPWSHNDFYRRWIAGQVASSGARHVLDVGCGTGNLIDRLRLRAVSVTGLEPDPPTARIAAARFAGTDTVVIEEAGFGQRDRNRRWDAITLVAVLHHLPLSETLRELRECLSPGGRLVVIGCYREASPGDFLISTAALVANPVMGLIKHPAPARSLPVQMTAPTAAARETLDEIRVEAAATLPGARIRRRLFWRYSLVYDKPAA